jgi:hypothetical protein
MRTTRTLTNQDQQLVSKIGQLTGRTPGNLVRGKSAQHLHAMSRVAGSRIRDQISSGLSKLAAGPNTTQQFSESFAAMAFTFLEERSPSLREFMLGFQVVDKDDELNTAFGVFGFELPNRIVQCPVFFVRGQIKGYQVMFLPEQQLFLPSHEGFVQQLINSDNSSNGEPGPVWGDMSTMADPGAVAGQMPRSIKYAQILKENSAMPPLPWAEETKLYESVASWFTDPTATKQLSSLLTEGNYKSAACSADDVLSLGSSVLESALSLAVEYPAMYKAMRGSETDRLQKIAEVAERNDSERVVSSRITFAGADLPKLIGKKAQDPTQTKVAVYIQPEPPRLLDKQSKDQYRDSISTHGIYVVDNRSETERSVLEKFSIDVAQDFQSLALTETVSGDVLMENGEVKSCVIVPKNYVMQFSWAGDRTPNIVLTSDGKSFQETHGNPVVTNVNEESAANPLLSMGSTGMPKTRGMYFAVTPKGKLIGPFCLRKNRDSTDKGPISVSRFSRIDYIMEVEETDEIYTAFIDGQDCDNVPMSTSANRDNCLVLPTDTRYIKIDTGNDSTPKDEYEYYSPKQKSPIYPETYDTISPKKLTDITLSIRKEAEGYIAIENKVITEKIAKAILVGSIGLSLEDASKTLTGLHTGHRQRFLIKNAATQVMQKHNPNAVFPMLEGPVGASEGSRVPYIVDSPEYAQQPIETPAEQNMTPEEAGLRDAMEGHPTSGMNRGPMAADGGMSMDPEMQQVMQSGIEGPMDISIVASSLSNARVDGAITQAIRHLLAGISETGRLILLLNAQRTAFEDMYPENDIKPLEDTLLSSFETAGDAYLRLKQKMAISDPAADAAVPFEHAM